MIKITIQELIALQTCLDNAEFMARNMKWSDINIHNHQICAIRIARRVIAKLKPQVSKRLPHNAKKVGTKIAK